MTVYSLDYPSTRRTAPWWLLILLLIALGSQIAWKSFASPPLAKMVDFGSPPSLALLRLSTLGDPIAMASVWMLWLQTFDDQAGLVVPFNNLNFYHLAAWLERILALDPRSEYPLFAAIRVYGFVQDPDKQRIMLDFVHRAFLDAPQQRWSWLALAAVQARHRLADHDLARLYMDEIGKKSIANQLPFWVQGLQARILIEQNELDSARAVIGGLLVHEAMSERKKQSLAIWLEKLAEREEILKNEKIMSN